MPENEELVKQYEKILNESYFARLTKTQIQDIVNNKKESVIYKKYSKEEIITALENPQSNEKKLRDMSCFLYNNSSHYKRLCNYFSKLPTYNYTISPYNLTKYNQASFMATYNKVLAACEKFNFKYSLIRMLNICMYQDLYCGLYYETEDSADFIQINNDYTKITKKIDSCLIYAIDMNYFKTREYLLDTYGDEIKNAYYAYVGYSAKDENGKKKVIKGNSDLRWFEPTNQICLKVNEDQLLYSLPPFSGIFPEILNLEDYKLLKKAETMLKNYKILVMKLPTEKETGKLLVDEKLLEKFYNQACKNVADGIGILASPFPIEQYDFQNSVASETDVVNSAESALWSASGANGSLFGSGDKLSASSIELSEINDESIVFAVVRQFENWFNKYLKNKNLPYDFKLKFLDQSQYNKSKVINDLLKAGQYGLPVRSMLCASVGLSPSEVLSMTTMENDILGLTEKFKPLLSSHTMTETEGGRPTNKSKGEDVTDSTEAGQENDSNDERG